MNYLPSALGSSKTLLGLIFSKIPNVIQKGKMNPNKNNNTQKANPPKTKNSNIPKPLIIQMLNCKTL